MINPQLLSLLQSDAALGGAAKYTGMDDPALQASVNAPILTPRSDPITSTFLSSDAIWGGPKTSLFKKALRDYVAAGSDTTGEVQNILDMINGAGFIATDPQTSTYSAMLVPLGGGSINDADATKALNTTSYIVGDGAIPLQDVTDTRAWMNIIALQTSAWQAFIATNDSRVAKINAGMASGALAPVDLNALDAQN